MNNQEARQRAEKKVEAKIGLYIHLAVYVVIITSLAIINYSTSTDYIWFKWPLIGWGIAVIIHALSIYNPLGESTIKERMIEKEMNKESQLRKL